MGIIGTINEIIELAKNVLPLIQKHNPKTEDFYYENFNKKVYIRNNGDGIIVSSFTLRVINPEKVEAFIRTYDIDDAKPDTSFPDFEVMKKEKIENIFSSFGFWVSSDENIITDVEEYYDDACINKKYNNKFLSLKFIVDTSKLKAKKKYNIIYAISIPGMFPIANGRLDTDSYSPSDYSDFKTSLSTNRIGETLSMSVYFDSRIDFKEQPIGHSVSLATAKHKEKTEKHICAHKNNLFYRKYLIEINNPHEYSSIYISWKLKQPAKEVK